MGICISVAEGVNDDNVTIFQARKVPNESQRLCSVYSQQGSKGLNQDAASVHEVCLTVSLLAHEIIHNIFFVIVFIFHLFFISWHLGISQVLARNNSCVIFFMLNKRSIKFILEKDTSPYKVRKDHELKQIFIVEFICLVIEKIW